MDASAVVGIRWVHVFEEDTGNGAIAAALAERGARPWQIELTTPVLRAALDAAIVGQVTRQ